LTYIANPDWNALFLVALAISEFLDAPNVLQCLASMALQESFSIRMTFEHYKVLSVPGLPVFVYHTTP
jgi:hypothetical protein